MTCAKQNSPSPSVSGEGRLPCLPWSTHPPLRTLFYIGYMYRGNPALKWLWKFVADGNLGDIRFIEADMNHDYQADRYADQLLDLAAVIRGEKPNNQDYDRDLRTHEITLKACGL